MMTICLPGSKYGTKIIKNTVELLLQLCEDTGRLWIELQNIHLRHINFHSLYTHQQ